ncbi:VOC family protein [Pelagovum pacificum]|uniref:VOC family protein n=1 Tax=Pelagovum pacificum TaxID=2588711 RepID=A0A5C5GFT6_9RHOB|nr:VOC family protein [Pelagovum pacificum]QQA43249.1 VOC family protein [Pelagovum pacificum]TNY33612.1 VOC family protein [Pelagovum pacificum]
MADTKRFPMVAAMTLFTEDLVAAKAFYALLLEDDPIHEDEASCVYKVGQTMLNLLRTEAVPELIDPLEMAQPSVRAVYTLPVEDVDAEVTRLQAAGITLVNGPMDRPWGIRTASVRDPSGHVWELAA